MTPVSTLTREIVRDVVAEAFAEIALSDRYVRTPEGVKKYGAPVGTLITADLIAKKARSAASSVSSPASSAKKAVKGGGAVTQAEKNWLAHRENWPKPVAGHAVRAVYTHQSSSGSILDLGHGLVAERSGEGKISPVHRAVVTPASFKAKGWERHTQASLPESGGAKPAEAPKTAVPSPGHGPAAPVPHEGKKAQAHLGGIQSVKDLTSSEELAIGDYVGSSFEAVNEELREPGSLVEGTWLERNAREVTRGLDSVFRKVKPTTEPITLWRGKSSSRSRLTGLKPGGTFSDAAFISASSDAARAEKFANIGAPGADAPTLVKITVPAGSRVLSVNHLQKDSSVVTAVGKDPETEDEVILPRGSQFQITGESELNGHRLLEMTYVPPGSSPDGLPNVNSSGHTEPMPGTQVKEQGGTAPSHTSHAHMTDAEYAAHSEFIENALAEELSKGNSTDRTETFDGHGQVYKPARAALHNQIVQEFLDKADKVPNDGKAVIAGGLGGAGKSTTLRNFAGIDPSQYITLNPDDIKEAMAERGMIPEVSGLSPMEAVALIHEESGHIVDLLVDHIYHQRKNVIWDITLSSPNSGERRITDLHKAGYTDVQGVFVDIPVETSVQRARSRHRRGMERHRAGEGFGGRYVPSGIIRASARGNSSVNRQSFDAIRESFDGWQIFDNSVHGRDPQLVGRSALPDTHADVRHVVNHLKGVNPPWTPVEGGGDVEFHGNLGIGRADMPQLSGVVNGEYVSSSVLTPRFLEDLQGKGIKIVQRRLDPGELHPVQTTGDSEVIHSIANDLRSGKLPDTKPIVVSQEGYVLDGHHTWAGHLLANEEGGRDGLSPVMPVFQVDLPIKDLLKRARAFGKANGIAQRSPGKMANPEFGKAHTEGLTESDVRKAEKGTG